MLAQPMAENIGGKDRRGLDMYFHEIHPECVKEIIFGYLMKTEHRKEISTIVEQYYPHVELFEAQPSETSFDLDIKHRSMVVKPKNR